MTEKSNTRPSQTELIRQHLESGKKITALEALYQYGCLRLSARIYELVHDFNLAISSETIEENGKHYSQYSLVN